MLASHRISLNALRVFALAARRGSLSQAAAQLGVTASAVSHQIRALERSLGLALFARSGNAIALTEAGQNLLRDAEPGLRLLDQAVERLTMDAEALRLMVSASFAVRWLIPALERFKRRQPQARIQIETSTASGQEPDGTGLADLVIAYHRHGDVPARGEKICADLCRPLLSPSLLARYDGDLAQLPALQATPDNWDWAIWAEATGTPAEQLRFADRFDIDDAALRAATAGMGVVLASTVMAGAELESGALGPLPGFAPVEIGAFYLSRGQRDTALIRRFRSWLLRELASERP